MQRIGDLNRRFYGCVIGLAIILVASALTSAAEVDPPSAEIGASVEESAPDPEPAIFESEITVTATKREATTQEIPVSIEVLTGERLTNLAVENVFEAAELVPNLTAGFGPVSNFVTIRGIGSGSERSFEQAVAMFVDGVYLPRSRQYLPLLLPWRSPSRSPLNPPSLSKRRRRRWQPRPLRLRPRALGRLRRRARPGPSPVRRQMRQGGGVHRDRQRRQ